MKYTSTRASCHVYCIKHEDFYITTTPYLPCNTERTVWLLLHVCNLDNGILIIILPVTNYNIVLENSLFLFVHTQNLLKSFKLSRRERKDVGYLRVRGRQINTRHSPVHHVIIMWLQWTVPKTSQWQTHVLGWSWVMRWELLIQSTKQPIRPGTKPSNCEYIVIIIICIYHSWFWFHFDCGCSEVKDIHDELEVTLYKECKKIGKVKIPLHCVSHLIGHCMHQIFLTVNRRLH